MTVPKNTGLGIKNLDFLRHSAVLAFEMFLNPHNLLRNAKAFQSKTLAMHLDKKKSGLPLMLSHVVLC